MKLTEYSRQGRLMAARLLKALVFSTLSWVLPLAALAGPYPPAAGEPGSTAVAANDVAIVGWADGFENYLAGSNVSPEFQTPAKALGVAGSSDGAGPDYNFDIVSLGRGGSITLTFTVPIGNGVGHDLCVFENSFSGTFLELAWVEVSSDGVNFARFDGASFTQNPVSAFGAVDPTDINGFAGKYAGGFCTPFDLSDLGAPAGVDLNRISHVRIIDIIGDGSVSDNLAPPFGPNPVYDPYPTDISAGFDLDAVAIFYFADAVTEANVPIPGPWLAVLAIVFLGVSLRGRRAQAASI